MYQFQTTCLPLAGIMAVEFDVGMLSQGKKFWHSRSRAGSSVST